MHVEKVLGDLGLHVNTVPEQRNPDGNFPTVEKPNPEEKPAMKMAVELGKKEDALNYEFGKQISLVADKVILVGEEKTKAIKKGLLDSNYDEENILILNRVVDAYKELEKLVGEKEVFALFENDLPDIYNEGGMKK